MFVLICSLAQVRTGLPKLFPSDVKTTVVACTVRPLVQKSARVVPSAERKGNRAFSNKQRSTFREQGNRYGSSQKKCKWQTGNGFSFYSFGLSRPLQTLGWKFSTSWPLGMAKESLGSSPMKWSQTLESRRQL